MTNTYPETTHTETILRAAASRDETCRCDDPIPVERAERKGAALRVCQRCGLRIALRLR
jgi:hypothetical protein